MCDWILDESGTTCRCTSRRSIPTSACATARTPPETLLAAYDMAKSQGIKYVYVGNVHDPSHDSTYCPFCATLLIERNWHELGTYHLRETAVQECQGEIAGRFLERPGDWGRHRLPVNISQFARVGERPRSDRSTSPGDSQMTKFTGRRVVRPIRLGRVVLN